jgi:cyclophilin family peptidyl-prolyl cis-trans isomerase
MASDKHQRQKELRQAKREAERKAAQRKEIFRRIRTALGLGLFVAVVLIVVPALTSDDEESLPPSYQEFRDQPTACGAEQPPPTEEMRFDAPEDLELSPGTTVTMVTSCGEIVIELDTETSPLSVDSFAFLAQEGFYDGTVFHRIVDDLLIQGGDPEASGTGGPGYSIPDELPGDGFVYDVGVVALAKTPASNSTGSQFFIVDGSQGAILSPTFNVIGRVVSGMDTVERIAAIETIRGVTREESKPTETAYVESIRIDE